MEVKIIVKEVRRQTAACLACQKKKQKCDGKPPCRFCADRKLPCEFAEKRKRGPKKLKVEPEDTQTRLAVSTSQKEYRMATNMELKSLITYFIKFSRCVYANSIYDEEKLLRPKNDAHKVQSYASMAMCSRLRGDFKSGRAFIAEARALVGAIVDCAHADAVTGLLLVSGYWLTCMEPQLSLHYATMAWSLMKMVDPSSIDAQTKFSCQMALLMSDGTTTHVEKSILLQQKANELLANVSGTSDTTIMSHILSLASIFVRVMGGAYFFPQGLKVMLHQFATLHLNEVDRLLILDELNIIQSLGNFDYTDDVQGVFVVAMLVTRFFVEWKSGHITDALSCALSIGTVLISVTISNDYPSLCMLGGAMWFLREHGYHSHANEINGWLANACKNLGPEYDEVTKLIEEEFATAHPTNQAVTTILIEEIQNNQQGTISDLLTEEWPVANFDEEAITNLQTDEMQEFWNTTLVAPP